MRFSPLMCLLAIAAFALTGEASGRQSAPYSAIVVFGTSLSDSGNAFALAGGNSTPPDYGLDANLVPAAPYALGGHHLTNGATWVEQLARWWGLAGSVRPAYASASPAATNYAVAAARAYDDGSNLNLGAQVQQFLTDHGGVAPSDALYVVEMGGNDIRDAMRAFAAGGLPGANAVLQQGAGSISLNIQLLYQAGARHFLVWLPPDVALTPAVRRQEPVSPGISQLASVLTQSFNAGLSAALDTLAALPGISITRLNAYTLLHAITAAPLMYGLTNVTDACVTPGVPPFFCQDADEYLYWDGVHPTAVVHTVVAQTAALVLMP